MELEIFQVDAFTDKLFRGNPAGVCLLPRAGDESWMQHMAKEMNLSETAFLYKQKDGFNLRWFTPIVEVELCGHATLASAHILWETGLLRPSEEARFYTQSGFLTAKRKGSWIGLNFPAQPEEPVTTPKDLVEALGVEPKYVGKNQFDYLVEVESEETVRNMKPNFTLLEAISSRGFIVTSLIASPEYDFVSRFFAPGVGVNEDPVTGSAHCCLGPFWVNRLGRNELIAYQASARGGVVRVRVGRKRVWLEGQAVTVFRGKLL